MADAEILAVTKRQKHMHKRQAIRLLLAAPVGDYRSKADPTLTQTEAIEQLRAELDKTWNNRLDKEKEKEVKEAADIREPEPEVRERPDVGHLPPEYQ